MKYTEYGFRAFDHQFNAVELNSFLRGLIKAFPDSGKANILLTYGYIDHNAGLTLEVLAAGERKGDSFYFFDPDDGARVSLRMESVKDEEFYWFADESGDLKKRYEKKIEVLKGYDVEEEIEKTREMDFLDSSRDPYFIDDILVYLTKEGLNPEGCWVRIEGLGDHFFMGTLLNEPHQDFGYHVGEKIAFFAQKSEDGGIICYTDMTPDMKLTAEDLADGSLLKESVHIFNIDRTQAHLIDVMEYLRDSFVWVPFTAVLSDRDQRMLENMVDKAGEDPNSLVGETFVTKDNTHMIPDILQNDDKLFFPAFTSIEEMGEYGDNLSKVQLHFLNVIKMATDHDPSVVGIVVNAFSESFVLDKELFDMVETMKSRLSPSDLSQSDETEAHKEQKFVEEAEDFTSLSETEKSAVIKQRVGQSIFRDKLIKRDRKCRICGLENKTLLRASHIKAWGDCEDGTERLDVNNGLLLCPIHDALFDNHLISFNDDGSILVNQTISEHDRALLNLDDAYRLQMNDKMKAYMKEHRTIFDAKNTE